MAKIFISHSSKDKPFVRRLAEDLQKMGIEPWLDEWEIKVGDCIVTKVEHGVAEADYVAIVLTPNSVKSGWVDREWKTKYWDEIDQGKTLVLPILAEQCDIPPLLKTKKYANFVDNYSVALVELMAAIGPVMRKSVSQLNLSVPEYSSDLTTLLGKVQNRSVPLSQCMAESLVIAQRARNVELERFCRSELVGWKSGQAKDLPHRLVDVYVCFDELNLSYVGWRGDFKAILSYLRADPKRYPPSKQAFRQPLSEIEAKEIAPTGSLLRQIVPASSIFPGCDPKHADVAVYLYASADCHTEILNAVRAELTKRLLELLPTVGDSTG